MALKQLIKTQMKWRKKTQKWVEIETATKIRINVIEKKNVRNCGFLLDQYARGRVLTQVPQAYERGSLCVTEILETLDSRTRTTESTCSLKVFPRILKNRHPGKLDCTSFH